MTDCYAIYLRKSRADMEAEKIGEGETLTRHKKILTDFATRNGYFVGKIYQEIVSGETIDARPQMKELLNDCYAGKYKGVIVIEVTRLSRGNQGDAQTILDCLKYANNNSGVLVLTPTKIYDVAHNTEDEEYMEFELFMSRREYKMIRKRMERGRRQAVIEGNFMGSYRPYGYDIVKTKTARTLVPNEAEAPVVKTIYDWSVNSHLSAGEIARKLTDMGIPTYSGSGEWSRHTIKSILTNPTYTGKVKWNDRMRVKKMVNGKLETSRPRSHTEQYMLYDGKHPAIISEEIFNAASKVFYRDKTKHNLNLINPLAGILCCKNCGKIMIYSMYSGKPNVKPRFTHPESQKCKVKSAVASDVIDTVVRSLELYIEDFNVKVDNLPQTSENAIQAQIDAMECEVKKAERKLSKLFDAWENETISDDDFVRRKKLHTDKIEHLKKQIENISDTIPKAEEYEEKISSFSYAINILKDPSLDAQTKNDYLKEIIEKIEYSRENESEFILDIYIK